MGCDHYRHEKVELRTGEANGDFTCIRGRVVVCLCCKAFVEGDEGSEYLFGHSRLKVVSGNAVFVATVSDQERVRLLAPRPTPAWNID